MQQPNDYGAYTAETTYELARKERSYASVRVAQCRDGLYRFAIDLSYSYGGRCGPITDDGEGFATMLAAKEAGAAALLDGFPRGFGDPQSVRSELAALRSQIEEGLRQPSLF